MTEICGNFVLFQMKIGFCVMVWALFGSYVKMFFKILRFFFLLKSYESLKFSST